MHRYDVVDPSASPSDVNAEQVSEGECLVEYDTQTFPFRDWFTAVLRTTDLEHLHDLAGVTVANFAEMVSRYRARCEGEIGGLQALLEPFFAEVVAPRFGAFAGRQMVPTMRFHFSVSAPELESEVNDLGRLTPADFLSQHYFESRRLGMFHRDRDYGLQRGAVNLWLPVTDTQGANALWLGGQAGGGRDSTPVLVRYGQALFFDGANRWHGAIWNTSGITRVSFDVRFYPTSAIAPSE